MNRPELTAERFITNPLPEEPGDLLYRTGDRVRFLQDGSLEFLGRSDRQVKLRGFRVELGEIEAALRAIDGIDDAAVVCPSREADVGNRHVIAFVVPMSDSVVSTPVLRKRLADQLPSFMVPSRFEIVDALPLTVNGKVDHSALLAGLHRGATERPRAAETELSIVERKIVAMWCEALELEDVGIHDDFFDSGGHSLIATQIVSRLSAEFSIDVPLARIYQSPTIAELSAWVDETVAQRVQGTQPLPSIVADPAHQNDPFPLTDVQQAYWIGRSETFELGNVATQVYFELDGDGLDVVRFNRAWQRLVERHAMLRAVVLPDGRQRILPEVPPYVIEMADLRDRPQAEVQLALESVRTRMSRQVLPATEWPLFEIRISRTGDRRTRVHMSIDALIVDAWSMLRLFEEWAELYRTPDGSLAPLRISYRDYVVAEQELRDTDRYRASERYWFDRLDTLPPPPELPLAHDRAATDVPEFRTRTAKVEPREWDQLKRWAAKADLTPSAVLLTAFSEILGSWSKSPRFTINLTLFNRLPLHSDVPRLIGDFTSLTLLEVHDSSEPFATRARRLQQQLWQDLDHSRVTGVRVMRELSRRQGGVPRATMPVVFTSVLGVSSDRHDLSVLETFGELGHSASQTAQVWLDHAVIERDGALELTWTTVERLFPDGMLDAMFDAYGRLVGHLSSDEAALTATRERAPASCSARTAAAGERDSPPLPGGDAAHVVHRAGEAPTGARRCAVGIVVADLWGAARPRRATWHVPCGGQAFGKGHWSRW